MRLIDADLIDLERVSDTICQQQAQDAIDDTPTADVVEVVRCGECMQREEKTGWCDVVQDYISNTNWFCAGGVRKDGADE